MWAEHKRVITEMIVILAWIPPLIVNLMYNPMLNACYQTAQIQYLAQGPNKSEKLSILFFISQSEQFWFFTLNPNRKNMIRLFGVGNPSIQNVTDIY